MVDRFPRQVSERYQIGDVIGDGNFAVVRECVERCSSKKFALKIIDKSKCLGKVGQTVLKLFFVTSVSCKKQSFIVAPCKCPIHKDYSSLLIIPSDLTNY